MLNRILLLLSFLCFGCSLGHLTAQVDTLLQVDTQAIHLSIDTLVQQLEAFTPEEKKENPTALHLANQIYTLGEQVSDTTAMIKAMIAQQNWYDQHEQSEVADSILFQRRQLSIAFGYVLVEAFDRKIDVYNYNIIYNTLGIFTDSSASIQLSDLLNQPDRYQFDINNNAGRALDSTFAYWVKLRLKGNGKNFAEHLLLIDNGEQYWQKVDFYRPDGAGDWLQAKGGALRDQETRTVKDWRDIFEVPMAAEGDFWVYIRLQGFKNANRPHDIYMRHLPGKFIREDLPKMLTRVNIFIGILAFQLFFFLLWYLATRESNFIPYLVYIGGILMIAVLSIHFKYWFPNPAWERDVMSTSVQIFFSWVAGMGMIHFTKSFLNTAQLNPKWHRALRIFQYIYSLSVLPIILILSAYLLFGLNSVRQFNQILQVNLQVYVFLFTVGLILITLVGISSWRKGFEPAKFYLIATICLLASVGFMSLIPSFELYHVFTFEQAMTTIQVGIILQLCVFALGVGNKRRMLEREKIEAQQKLLAEQNKVNSAFGRFVPHKFLEAIGRDSVLDIELGDGVEKEVTVFFSDIRGYTRLAEQMHPQENFRFLNGYLGRMGPIIADYQGFVNQYYGDGIMAIFIQNPQDALQAAIGIQHRLESYNAERQAKGRMPIQIGIGLHTGPLIMGVIGDTLRMEAGVVSDTVNTTSRMEGLTKHFGARILISETVFNGIPQDHDFAYRYLGKVQVKGRQEPLKVYDFFDGDAAEIKQQKHQSKIDFDQAINAYYQKDFAQAAASFDRVLAVFPTDISSKLYLARAKDYLLNGIAENWNGVEEMMAK